ncbi:MAG: PAS domain S-box protein [Candidatus Hydrogenedentota bacterium]
MPAAGQHPDFREIVEQANSIILRFDTKGVLTYINPFALEYFGYSYSEVIGKSLIGVIVPETETSGRDLDRMIADIAERPELYARNENENVLRDGERVWIAWSNTPLRDEDGTLFEILSVGNDISPRRHATELLRGRHRNVAAIHRVTEAMLDAGTLTRGIEPACAVIAPATDFAMAAIALRDAERDCLFCRASHGLPSDSAGRAAELPVWESTAGGVVRTGRTLAQADLDQRPQYKDDWLEALGVRRMLIAPMRSGETVVGALILLDPRPAEIDDDLTERAEAFARHLARFVTFGAAR